MVHELQFKSEGTAIWPRTVLFLLIREGKLIRKNVVQSKGRRKALNLLQININCKLYFKKLLKIIIEIENAHSDTICQLLTEGISLVRD